MTAVPFEDGELFKTQFTGHPCVDPPAGLEGQPYCNGHLSFASAIPSPSSSESELFDNPSPSKSCIPIRRAIDI